METKETVVPPTASNWWSELPHKAWQVVVIVARNLYTWQWTKSLVYWLIISAGTASELAFLVSSLWMSVNANVHPFILTIMSEGNASYLTYLATVCYVSLPIFIVGLATILTVQQVKMWKINKTSIVWSILFGLPAITFLVMDMFTIGAAVANVDFIMPQPFVVIRALSAFTFAFSSFLYNGLGKPGERERLATKDGLLATLRTEMTAALQKLAEEKEQIIAGLLGEKKTLLATFNQEKESLLAKIDVQRDEIESLKSLLTETQKGFTELHRAVNKSEDTALEAYGEECVAWLKGPAKSAKAEEITRYTGIGTAKINNALKRGDLKVTPNNKELILMSSLIQWLRNLASSDRKTDPNIPALRLVND